LTAQADRAAPAGGSHRGIENTGRAGRAALSALHSPDPDALRQASAAGAHMKPRYSIRRPVRDSGFTRRETTILARYYTLLEAQEALKRWQQTDRFELPHLGQYRPSKGGMKGRYDDRVRPGANQITRRLTERTLREGSGWKRIGNLESSPFS